MNITVIIQARMGSSRLPGKVLKEVFPGKSLLSVMIDRLRLSKLATQFIVATTSLPADQLIAEECQKLEVLCYQSLHEEVDVLSRFVDTAKHFNAELIVRICADSPLHDAEILDACIQKYLEMSNKLDFVTNFKPETYPYGTAVEVFPFDVLLRMDRLSKEPDIREHVTQFFHRNPNLFRYCNVTSSEDFSTLKWAVDTVEDFEMIRTMYSRIGQQNLTENWRSIASRQFQEASIKKF